MPYFSACPNVTHTGATWEAWYGVIAAPTQKGAELLDRGVNGEALDCNTVQLKETHPGPR